MMSSKKIGFGKWLYTRTIEVIHDPMTQIMGALLSGILTLACSLVFVVTTPLMLLGFPAGILMILYGVYKIEH